MCLLVDFPRRREWISSLVAPLKSQVCDLHDEISINSGGNLIDLLERVLEEVILRILLGLAFLLNWFPPVFSHHQLVFVPRLTHRAPVFCCCGRGWVRLSSVEKKKTTQNSPPSPLYITVYTTGAVAAEGVRRAGCFCACVCCVAAASREQKESARPERHTRLGPFPTFEFVLPDKSGSVRRCCRAAPSKAHYVRSVVVSTTRRSGNTRRVILKSQS